MRIIVDAMGGDNAPESAVWGGALAAKEYGEEVLLVGKPEVVANVLKEKGLSEVKGMGQVCPQFTIAWAALSTVAVWVEDRLHDIFD